MATLTENKRQSVKALIRTDASVTMGLGHLMRCLTLADELQNNGVKAYFVCREFDKSICNLINERGYFAYRLPLSRRNINYSLSELKHANWLGEDWLTDAKQTKKIIIENDFNPDILIVDHYAIDYKWERVLKPYVKKILIIDDIADRLHDCNMLLDQNFFPDMEVRYKSLVPKSCKKFLGPKYALLRPEFRETRKQLRKRSGNVKRLLITFGGSDPENVTEKVIEAVCRLERNDISCDIVVGGVNPNKEKIKKLCSNSPNMHYHYRVENMAKLMEISDLMIGSCGSTTWERCCLGLPGLLIAIASNQSGIGRACHDAGIGIYLNKSKEITPEILKNEIEKIVDDKNKLLSMSKMAMGYVDGNGAPFVAKLLVN